jgi:hypothetical protein
MYTNQRKEEVIALITRNRHADSAVTTNDRIKDELITSVYYRLRICV